MDRRPSPEVREVGGRSQAWSIGSQLLGDCERGPAQQQNRIPSSNYHESISTSSAFIDIHDGTAQYPPGQDANAGPLSSSNLRPRDLTTQSPSIPPSTMDESNARGRTGSQDEKSIRPLLRASTTFYDRIITDWWWWEFFSWFVGFASVAAIVGMLLFYSGKKQPNRVFLGMTLNAYISVFSAVAKAAMILPVSEAIGQLKWMWFRKESRLSDFSAFDGASRGPWGSLILLGSTRFKDVASLGALITILALAFEPFFQQIVNYPSRFEIQGSGRVSIARTYNPENDMIYITDGGQGTNPYGLSMVTAIDEVSFGQNVTTKPAPVTCPTGRCTWGTYSSLGVCHQCKDVSSMARPFCSNNTNIGRAMGATGVREPCGWTINGTYVVGTEDGGESATLLSTIIVGGSSAADFPVSPAYWNSTTFKDVPYPIVDFYVAYTEGGEAQVRRNATPKVMNCMLQWCVKTYQSSFDNGSQQETLLKTVALESLPFANNSQDWTQRELFSITVDEKNFSVVKNTTEFLGQSMRRTLPIYLDNTNVIDGKLQGMWSFVQDQPPDINAPLEQIATAMTNSMRSRINGNDTEDIQGLAWGKEDFVQVEWAWITLPGALLAGSFIFVSSTILRSRKDKTAAWKSSALATLLHGLSKDARDRFDPHLPPSQVEAVSRGLRVKLSKEEDGNTRLVTV